MSVAGDIIKSPNVYCKTPSKALKMKDLASNVITNDCPIERYASSKDAISANGQVYDLVISGLPFDAKSEHIRQIA